MKKLMTISGLVMTVSILLSSCSSKKNDYPADVTQNFMNTCQATSGNNQKLCSCLLDKIQEKYTYEEFSGIEVKMLAGQTPDDFLEFVGKASAQCTK